MIRTLLALIYVFLYLVVGLPVLGILTLYRKKNKQKAEAVATKIVRWGFNCVAAISGARVNAIGLENIPEDVPVAYIGNHRSIFDVILSFKYTKGVTGYIAKDNLKKVPILPMWMEFIHCLFLDRKNPRDGLRVVISAIDNIKSGVSVFVFPEGTRSKDGSVGEFKEGTFKIATKTKCPIIPVAISGTENIFEKHVPFIKACDVTMHFGKPIMPDDIVDSKKVGAQVREAIVTMLEEDSKE